MLNTLSQAKALTALVNKSLKISEEDAMRAMTSGTKDEVEGRVETTFKMDQHRGISRGEKLVKITIAINKQLTLLLAIIQVKISVT